MGSSEVSMSNISAKISQSYRYFFYGILSVSLITGSGFWLLQHYAMQEGDFGLESHFLQYPTLQVHGFSAFLMLMCLGAIFASHIPKNWHYGRGKKSGASIAALTGFSVLSAYSLYYLVGEDWHTWLANTHAIVGLLLPAVLFFHIKFARKSKANKVHKKYRKSKNNNETH